MKKILGNVLKDYPGITTGLDRLEFEAPFEPCVHRWERLEKARQAEQDPEAKRSGMEYNRTPTRKRVNKEGRPCCTRCNNHQALLDDTEPGCLVLMIDGGHERLFVSLVGASIRVTITTWYVRLGWRALWIRRRKYCNPYI